MIINGKYIRLSYVEKKEITEEIWKNLDTLAGAVWNINKDKKGTSEVLSACTEVQKMLNNIISNTLEIIEKEIREEIRGE